MRIAAARRTDASITAIKLYRSFWHRCARKAVAIALL